MRIEGLTGATQHEGKHGVATRFLPTKGRWAVLVAHDAPVLSLKPTNPRRVALDAERRSAVLFDARALTSDAARPASPGARGVAAGPESPLAGWPTTENETMERAFLRQTLGWKRPAVVTGVRGPDSRKPIAVFYFDAESASDETNHVARRIFRLLPEFERTKVERPESGIKGACVLVSDATTTMSEYSRQDGSRGMKTTTHADFNAGGGLSVEDAMHILAWHFTDAAGREYRDAGDPMKIMASMMMDHRMNE